MRADPAGHESKQVYPLSNKKASPNNQPNYDHL